VSPSGQFGTAAWGRPVAVVLLLLGFWFLSISSVATQLELDARARESVWRRPPNSPWHWRLAEPDAVVWPGSAGLSPALPGSDAVAGSLGLGRAYLSLALRGERIDLALVTGALLRLETSAPLRVSLVGQRGQQEFLLGAADLPASARGGHLPLQSDARQSLDALRLHLDAAPGTQVSVGEVLLLAPDGTRATPCPMVADPLAEPAECHARVPMFAAHERHRPEALLSWRDRILQWRPAAVVRAHPQWPAWPAPLLALRNAPGGWLVWMLAALPLLGLLVSRLPGVARASRALLELALVFAPCLFLLWCGWPARDTGVPIGLALASSLACAASMRDPLGGIHWRGDATAWRGAAAVIAGAAALVGAAALANAADGDGFAWQPFGSDHAWRYPLWALLQQWILMRAIAPRMRQVWRSDASAAIAAGALFGLLHLPNLSLMLLTFLAGIAWAWLGLRQRALLPLAVSHAALGLTLFAVVPPWLVRSAEVGGRFLMEP
jgi:hypothetical protein